MSGFDWYPSNHVLFTTPDSDTVSCGDATDTAHEGLLKVERRDVRNVFRAFGSLFVSGSYSDRRLNYEHGGWEKNLKLCSECLQDYVLDRLDRIEKALRSI